MAFASSGGGKFVSEVTQRAAYGKEHGVVTGTGSDQAANLDRVLDEICMPEVDSSPGRDQGIYYLPPGRIRLDSLWSMLHVRGVRIEGTGHAHNSSDPRDSGGRESGGTSLYWGGSEGGTMMRINQSLWLTLADFALYLGEDSSSDHAEVGIEFRNDVKFGNGNHCLERLLIQAYTRGSTIGMKFGEEVLDPNMDTMMFHRISLYTLDTGFIWKHLQALEWTFVGTLFQAVNTYWHFENGGNFYAYGTQAQENRNNVEVVFLKVDQSTANSGSYLIDGLYLDRQGSDVWVTIFETGSGNLNSRFVGRSINVRRTDSGSSFDGTERAYIEPTGGNWYTLDNCGLPSQSIVRWGTANSLLDRESLVTIRNCRMDRQNFGSRLVTCNEGGYCGTVRFEGVQLHDGGSGAVATVEDVTVNEFPLAGSRATHRDIDNFDSTESGAFASSWLGGGQTASPDWAPNLKGYWPMNEEEGETTLVDLVNDGADDLTVDSDVQVPNPPMPYLDWWSQFDNNTAGVDTGLLIDPSLDDLTLFFYTSVRASDTTRVATIAGATSNFQFLRQNGSTFNLIYNGSGGGKFINNFSGINRSPCFFVITVDASADTIKTFANGILVSTITSAGYNSGIGAGNLWIGGDTSLRWPGKLSRFGVVVGSYLTDKEATLLSMQAATCARRKAVRPD